MDLFSPCQFICAKMFQSSGTMVTQTDSIRNGVLFQQKSEFIHALIWLRLFKPTCHPHISVEFPILRSELVFLVLDAVASGTTNQLWELFQSLLVGSMCPKVPHAALHNANVPYNIFKTYNEHDINRTYQLAKKTFQKFSTKLLESLES